MATITINPERPKTQGNNLEGLKRRLLKEKRNRLYSGRPSNIESNLQDGESFKTFDVSAADFTQGEISQPVGVGRTRNVKSAAKLQGSSLLPRRQTECGPPSFEGERHSFFAHDSFSTSAKIKIPQRQIRKRHLQSDLSHLNLTQSSRGGPKYLETCSPSACHPCPKIVH